jgi:hypothetical protein
LCIASAVEFFPRQFAVTGQQSTGCHENVGRTADSAKKEAPECEGEEKVVSRQTVQSHSLMLVVSIRFLRCRVALSLLSGGSIQQTLCSRFSRSQSRLNISRFRRLSGGVVCRGVYLPVALFE